MAVKLTRKERAGFGTTTEKTLELIGKLDDKTKQAALNYLSGNSTNSPVMNTLIEDAMDVLSTNPNQVIPISENTEEGVDLNNKNYGLLQKFAKKYHEKHNNNVSNIINDTMMSINNLYSTK